MSIFEYMTPQEIQQELGRRVRALRLNKRLTLEGVARRANVSKRALQNLEAGEGSSLATLIPILKSLDALAGLDALAPVPMISPIAMLSGPRMPKRGSRS